MGSWDRPQHHTEVILTQLVQGVRVQDSVTCLQVTAPTIAQKKGH